jgi:cytochrome c551
MNLLKKLSMILAIMILTIGLVAACGATEEQTSPDNAPAEGVTENETPVDQPDQEDTADETDTEDTADESAGDPDVMATGEAVVSQACISCHGANLEGGYGPSLQNIGDKYNKEEIVTILINGKGSMPGNLAEGNEEAVAVYLLSLQ